jgi:hypothetical protein
VISSYMSVSLSVPLTGNMAWLVTTFMIFESNVMQILIRLF